MGHGENSLRGGFEPVPAKVAVTIVAQARTPSRRLPLCGGALLAWGALALSVVPCAAASVACGSGKATGARVGQPTRTVAWRAQLLGATAVYGRIPSRRARRHGHQVGPYQAGWLLVLGARLARTGECWLQVRLPTRPNNASAWLNAEQVVLRRTPWRIEIAPARRTLTVTFSGIVVRTVSVVVGAPATPTPTGLFSIIGAWRSPPNAFLGSWILALTAHSDVLQAFEGGDGTVGIHGRGGASLLAPLGTAASHGCIRLANSSIDWLVQAIGENSLAGIPVTIS
jgi:hypothetical protein